MIYKFIYTMKDGRTLKHISYTEREAITFFSLLIATRVTSLSITTIPKRKFQYVKR